RAEKTAERCRCPERRAPDRASLIVRRGSVAPDAGNGLGLLGLAVGPAVAQLGRGARLVAGALIEHGEILERLQPFADVGGLRQLERIEAGAPHEQEL